MTTPSSFNSMMAVRSIWGQNRTFRLFPVDGACPYVECIYDPETKILVVISTNKKQSYHMLPVLDDNGDPVPSKRSRMNGKQMREERRMVDTYQEYYLVVNEEIYDFLDKVSINKDFDFKTFVEAPPVMPAAQAAGIDTGVIVE